MCLHYNNINVASANRPFIFHYILFTSFVIREVIYVYLRQSATIL